MKNIQIKTTKMIANVFRFTTKNALNVEMHLLSIENHMKIVLYDFMLRIIISSIYSLIKNQRIQFDRFLILEVFQHVQIEYVKFNLFHKLKIRYAVIVATQGRKHGLMRKR